MAQRIFIASDQLLVSHLCNLLEKAGIPALTQKAVVDAPQEECTPLAWYSELWIMRDGQLASARQLLGRALAGDVSRGRELSGLESWVASLPPAFSPPVEIA
ncbi:hypothetical protein [Microbulbifer halophilus]|uniref:DUF2007 domain-containing protein n=1 Tax=Microbulbifer halophilus TaxID=453963 RepID=A0ABW5EA70_9GAMM|nr:hypothetical protein [Microbulbifer halophilus]MCW8124961.1 hypothetical protein [Microbulbifer halophilus]